VPVSVQSLANQILTGLLQNKMQHSFLHKEGSYVGMGSVLSGESMEEQRQGNEDGKKRLRRLIWMGLCNILLRHEHLLPSVPPSFEGGTGRVQEIC